MMDACPKPLRRESALVAKQLVQKYRESLEDRLNGDVVGNGYEGVLCSMQNRIDNQCRGRSDIPRKRRPRSASASVQSQGKIHAWTIMVVRTGSLICQMVNLQRAKKRLDCR